MKLSATQIEALRTLAHGEWRQVRVSSSRESGGGWLMSTIRALRERGMIETRATRERETTQGRSTYFVLIDARITDAGRTALAMLAAD